MAYFAAEKQKDWRACLPGLMFERNSLHNFLEHDRYGATNSGRDNFSIVEGVINHTEANIIHGRPLIRCNYANGGADQVTYNTQVAGGADSGISTNGCFLNFCGTSAFQTKSNYALVTPTQVTLFIFFPDLTAMPAVGAVLTQAVSTASGTVVAVSNFYNYVEVMDLNTGVWDITNVVTDSGLTMVPAAPIPNHIVHASQIEGNADMFQNGAGIWAVIRGYTLAWVQGDDAGVGYNGDITDCTSLTWNDDIAAYVAANYHDIAEEGGASTVDVYVNPDNVVAHAMEVAGDNSGNTPELILVYMRADEPLVYAESSKQGVYPGIQRA